MHTPHDPNSDSIPPHHHGDRVSTPPLSTEMGSRFAHEHPLLLRALSIVAPLLMLGALGGAAWRFVSSASKQTRPATTMVVGHEGETTRSGVAMTSESEESQEDTNEASPWALDFDEELAEGALEHRAPKAAHCAHGKGRAAKVSMAVAFSPSGVSTKAVVEEGVEQNSPVASCLAANFEGVTIPAFRGSERVVRVSVAMR